MILLVVEISRKKQRTYRKSPLVMEVVGLWCVIGWAKMGIGISFEPLLR